MRFRRIIIVLTNVLFVLAFFGAPPNAHARDKAVISGTSARFDGRIYHVAFRVEGAFSEDIERAVLSGLPATFTYYFRLFRILNVWPDELVQEFQVVRTIQYDNIRQSYTVTQGEKTAPVKTRNAAEAHKLMTEFSDMTLAGSGNLPAGSYFLLVKAQMEQVTLPAGIDRLFFFTSFLSGLWGFDTIWTRIDLPARTPFNPAAGDKP